MSRCDVVGVKLMEIAKFSNTAAMINECDIFLISWPW